MASDAPTQTKISMGFIKTNTPAMGDLSSFLYRQSPTYNGST